MNDSRGAWPTERSTLLLTPTDDEAGLVDALVTDGSMELHEETCHHCRRPFILYCIFGRLSPVEPVCDGCMDDHEPF